MSRIERQTIPAVSVSDFNLAQKELASRQQKSKSYYVVDANENGMVDAEDEFYRSEWRRETWAPKLKMWSIYTTPLDPKDLPRVLLKTLQDLPKVPAGKHNADWTSYLTHTSNEVAGQATKLLVSFSKPEIHAITNSLVSAGTTRYDATETAVVYANGKRVREIPVRITLGALSAAQDVAASKEDFKRQLQEQLAAPLAEAQAQVLAELEPGRQALQDFAPELMQKLGATQPGTSYVPVTSVEIDPAELDYFVNKDHQIEKRISRAALYAAISISVDFSQLDYVIHYDKTYAASEGESVTQSVFIAVPTVALAGLTDPVALREKLMAYTADWTSQGQGEPKPPASHGSWSRHSSDDDSPASNPWQDGRTVTLYDRSTHKFSQNQVEGGQLKAGTYVQTPNGRVKILSSEQEDGGTIIIESDDD